MSALWRIQAILRAAPVIVLGGLSHPRISSELYKCSWPVCTAAREAAAEAVAAQEAAAEGVAAEEAAGAKHCACSR
jgi:hypothetical protein